MDDDQTPPDDHTTEPPETPEWSQEARADPNAPPQDMAAERATLGAMLISKAAIGEVVEVVRGIDFYRPNHETIYDAITDLYTRGESVDMLTAGHELERRGALMRVGGPTYLHTLASEVPIAANAAVYAEKVREKAVRRRLVDAGTRIAQIARVSGDDVSAILDQSQAEVFAAFPRDQAQDYVLAGIAVEESIDAIEAMADGPSEKGIPTGFYDLDDLTGGWLPGQMIVVAGRPAMGKSTAAVDFMRSCSIRHRRPSVIFSLEMTRAEIAMRLLSAESKVPLHRIRNGDLEDNDWQRISAAYQGIAQAPLYIDDSPNMTMTEIRAKARRLQQDHGLDLVVIDYIQLMSSGKRVESRQLEVSEFSRQIKLLAKELMVPVIALSQLNRGPEQRTVKRPALSDLRESGAIEQDSDLVLLIHREDMYEVESSRPGEADFIIAKHRNGATRDIAVAAQLHYSRFADLAR